MASAAMDLQIGKRKVKVSNLEKVFYPTIGFTKADLIDYYVRVSPVLLPHLKDRPMTLKRYPEGVDGQHFYQKEAPGHTPDWVQIAPVKVKDRTIHYVVFNDLPSLVWGANLADIELHPLLSRRQNTQRPTVLAFDLDPGAPADVRDCARVALRLRELFAGWGVECYAKTSGSKGFQVYVPLNTPVTYEETKPFAKHVAHMLEAEAPKRVTSNMPKALRVGKVFVDWSQNDDFKTTVCVYSLRAKERPTVSTPMAWEEVETGVASNKLGSFVFETKDVLARVEERGDLFAGVLTQRQKLPQLDA